MAGEISLMGNKLLEFYKDGTSSSGQTRHSQNFNEQTFDELIVRFTIETLK